MLAVLYLLAVLYGCYGILRVLLATHVQVVGKTDDELRTVSGYVKTLFIITRVLLHCVGSNHTQYPV